MSRHVPQVTNRYGPDVSVDLRNPRVWAVFVLSSVAYGVVSLACVLIAVHGFELSAPDTVRPSLQVEGMVKLMTVVTLLFAAILLARWRVGVMTRGRIGPEDQIVMFRSILLALWFIVLFAIFMWLLIQRPWFGDHFAPIGVSLQMLGAVIWVGIWAWDPVHRLLLLMSQNGRRQEPG